LRNKKFHKNEKSYGKITCNMVEYRGVSKKAHCAQGKTDTLLRHQEEIYK